MNEQLKLPQTVILIDATYLNFVITDLKRNFERMLGRPLQPMDMAGFVTYLSLDFGLPETQSEIQTIFVYEQKETTLIHSTPSNLTTELNGTAFRNGETEYTFASLSPEDVSTRQELLLELASLITDSKETKNILLVLNMNECGEELATILAESKQKKIAVFSMDNSINRPTGYRNEVLAYPMMQALGIKAEEL
ncbi:hypothetical protein D0T50_13005 [Bacteroides sp. 214]|uniref:DUF6621 family protein n=1 Tax=Bacteroides sp. 214 TaxID=2302935 RepID=UPI0013D214F0|nr:DUF6621 family protein [Bacteroides sp. 214]NDW13800.1 hypothetical protein [Bacteroides sp. 214]